MTCTASDVVAALIVSALLWPPVGMLVWYRWGTHLYHERTLPPPDNGRRTK